MLKKHLLLTFRRIWRHKMYSGITITGLAVGFACFGLLMSYVLHEQSYENIHTKANRIFRVVGKLEFEGQGENSSSCTFPMGPTLQEEYPQLIENYTRLFNFQEPEHTLRYEKNVFNEHNIYLADSGFFSVFDYVFIAGDKKTALAEPGCIVLTKEAAQKYFGAKNALGEQLLFDGNIPLKVTGIVEKPKGPSHIHYDGLISFSTIENIWKGIRNNWVWNPCWTYILLKDPKDATELEKAFPDFIRKHYPDFLKPQVSHQLQSLKSIHLHSHLDYEMAVNGNYWTVIIFAVTGILVLVIACINYINLSLAEIPLRLKEIAIRKINGASPRDIRRQVFYESLIIVSLGLLLSLALYELFIKIFATVYPGFAYFNGQINVFFFSCTLIAAVFSVLAGHFYPAFVLSKKIPADVSRNTLQAPGKKNVFSSLLVGFQFFISLLMVYATIVVKKQTTYLQQVDPGFNKEQLLVIPIRPPMAGFFLSYIPEIEKINGVEHVSIANDILGSRHNTHEFNYDPMEKGKWKYFGCLYIDEEFIPATKIQLLAGRNFAKQYVRDDSLSIIVNESMVKALGWGTPAQALGKRLSTPAGSEHVIGVVKDFHTDPLHKTVGPFVLDMPHRLEKLTWSRYIYIKCRSNDIQGIVKQLSSTWNALTEEFPFNYQLLDDSLRMQYRNEESTGVVMSWFSIISVFIAVFGLFNLVSFIVERKIKEIGIRKVLGSTTGQILLLFIKRFLPVILISVCISIPISIYLANLWLSQFAYHFTPGIPDIALAVLIVISISVATIIARTYRAAAVNPVKSLRYE